MRRCDRPDRFGSSTPLGDGSECHPLDDATSTELWGGLYASGHLEIASGSIGVDKIIESVRSAAIEVGFEPNVIQNRAGRMEVTIFGRGFRSLVDTKAPLFSLHMDAELGTNYKASRAKFDSFTEKTIANINAVCEDESVDLKNPMDLDFSYTDASNAFSVLKSEGAKLMSDPLSVAIRDWHRTRGK